MPYRLTRQENELLEKCRSAACEAPSRGRASAVRALLWLSAAFVLLAGAATLCVALGRALE